MFLSFWIDDCAVIDEIQMMNDNERGWAWTRALLGLLCIFSPFFALYSFIAFDLIKMCFLTLHCFIFIIIPLSWNPICLPFPLEMICFQWNVTQNEDKKSYMRMGHFLTDSIETFTTEYSISFLLRSPMLRNSYLW